MASPTSSPTSSPTVSPTPSSTSGSNGGGSGPSSPLLFFVALGFGVVFTNLWIIVGVKYCFRYNQRTRQRMNGEDPEAVDLGAMPRQHRRRREKKLMTMDEVNEKFPLIKYKTWRSNRADKGLSTAGGITNASRPASIHNRPRDSKDGGGDSSESRELTQAQTATTVDEKSVEAEPEHGTPEMVGDEDDVDARPSTPSRPKSSQSTMAPSTPVHKVTTNDEDDDDEEPIQTAVPAEQLPDPGDACAICIDTIEDDDDIRGLHCGHAFHAACVDPWLTSRRACCPLCKADYYVPKPRPEGANLDGVARIGPHVDLQPPPGAFSPGNGRAGRRPAMILPGRFMSIVYHDRDRHGFPVVVRTDRPGQAQRDRRRQRQEMVNSTTTVDGGRPETPGGRSGWWSRLRLPLPGQNRPVQPQISSSSAPELPPTPAQLEAGR